MGSPKDIDKDDWRDELTRAITRRLPGLDREIFRPGKHSVLVDGDLSLRHWRGHWLAVVRGARVDGGGRVVCFGAGQTALDALRNVAGAIWKGEWRRDRFQPSAWRQPDPSTDQPKPIDWPEGFDVGGDFQPPLPVAK